SPNAIRAALHCKTRIGRKKIPFSPPRVLVTSGGLVQQSRLLCPHSPRAGGGPHHRALEAAYGLISSLSPAMRSYASFALLMRYSYSRPLCGSCFGHFIDPTRHIATDCRPEHHALTDMEFM